MSYMILKEKFDKIAKYIEASAEIRKYLASSLDELYPKLKFMVYCSLDFKIKDTMERLEKE